MGTCAAMTFSRAVSSVNGGIGYLIGSSAEEPPEAAITAMFRVRLPIVHALNNGLVPTRRKGLLSKGKAIAKVWLALLGSLGPSTGAKTLCIQLT